MTELSRSVISPAGSRRHRCLVWSTPRRPSEVRERAGHGRRVLEVAIHHCQLRTTRHCGIGSDALRSLFEPNVRQRLADDSHVLATVLLAEVAALGDERAYQTFTRQLRGWAANLNTPLHPPRLPPISAEQHRRIRSRLVPDVAGGGADGKDAHGR